ncbi:MAG: type II toxin-antitoxin system Phd/YefM family antitoxin [Solirubrobacteraceae bacterium]
MAETISQRELRNNSGEIMRRLDAGEEFIVTRNGVPVGELKPVRRRRFVDRDRLQRVFADLPPEDIHDFHRDIDQGIDQDPTPRV